MDIIFLQELKVKTLIGIYPWERDAEQIIQLDLEIALPHNRACQTDNFEDALDYSLIVQRINETLSQKHFSLLEALADEYPDWTFLWVDVEDSPDWLGDEDIENFPTILVQDRDGTRYWGAVQPRAEHVRRLIDGAADLPALAAGPGGLDALARD